ncbi:hypothetical protein AMAG_11967 [Allomyces macrogynus ATCC 38327]|uniref:Endonuclease/exonuclease/phosphatase domain-containing protein n=1 Tax=Allomyces macrogynus (strain ATCC 38327) TaxID=578462 RepID=A0A0L0SYA6_ALLM3|nr:hypothetical protein AMAG_11967 [Allomyces macrogynus ATCC 38327]|eukprot:KNE67508.1 hypothetical protein AMAG_11967 [Allomyces macrogynus ATCC 38327]
MDRVSTLDPDLLCLQGADRFDELWDLELTIRGYQHLHRHKDAGRHGCPIAWRAATWDLLNLLMDALAKLNDQNLRVNNCGDFNSQPQLPQYCVLTKRTPIPSQIEDLLDIPDKDEDVRQPK